MLQGAYILDSLIGTLKANIDASIELNAQTIVQNVIEMSDAMYLVSGENRIREYADIFMHEGQEIEDYINVLIIESKNYPNVAQNIFNG